MQGDRVSGARKPATLETGKVVQVPLFVEIGDRVKVDTRSGDYITRVMDAPRRRRSDARERALYLLYEAQTRRGSPRRRDRPRRSPSPTSSRELVRGVDDHRRGSTRLIAAQGEGLDAGRACR